MAVIFFDDQYVLSVGFYKIMQSHDDQDAAVFVSQL